MDIYYYEKEIMIRRTCPTRVTLIHAQGMLLSRRVPPYGAIKYQITLHKVTPAPTLTLLYRSLLRVALSDVLKQTVMFIVTLPYYVIIVPQVKFLLVLPCVVHNSHTGDEIDYFLGGRVVQVVAALVSPVSVNPFQSQVAIGSSPVSHVRTSVSQSLSRRFSDILSFTETDLF